MVCARDAKIANETRAAPVLEPPSSLWGMHTRRKRPGKLGECVERTLAAGGSGSLAGQWLE